MIGGKIMKRQKNKNVRSIYIPIITAVLWLLLLPLQVYAQDSYQVTFRAGNLGTINSSTYYSVTAAAGTSITDVIAGNGIVGLVTVSDATEYYVEPVSKWKMNSEAIGSKVVERNCDIVISYGRLINSLEYMVKYLDIDTGVQVAEPMIGRGEKGDSLATAPLTNISNYVLVSPVTNQTIVLGSSGVNEVIYYYRSTLVGTITENIANQTVPGGTTTTTEIVDNIINQPVALAAGPGGGAAEGNAVVIEDGGTPLAAEVPEGESSPSTKEGEEEKQTTIGDPEVPHIDTLTQEKIIPIIFAIAISLLVVILGAYILLRRKMMLEHSRKEVDETNQTEK